MVTVGHFLLGLLIRNRLIQALRQPPTTRTDSEPEYIIDERKAVTLYYAVMLQFGESGWPTY